MRASKPTDEWKQQDKSASPPVDRGGEPPDDGSIGTRLAKLEDFAVDTRERLVRIETQLEQTATKADLADLKIELKSDLSEQKADFKLDLSDLKAEFKSDLSELKAEFKSDLSELKAEFKSEISELRAELKSGIGQVEKSLFTVQSDLEGKINALQVEMHKGFAELIRWMVGTAIVLGAAGITIITFVLNHASPKAPMVTTQAPAPIVIQLPPYPQPAQLAGPLPGK